MTKVNVNFRIDKTLKQEFYAIAEENAQVPSLLIRKWIEEYVKNNEEETKMTNFKNVGNWWADKGIELVEIEGTVYGLNGWNGEKYTESFKVTDADHTEASEEEYSIVPQYEEIDSEYQIVGYEVE